jgi:sialic acid synthase SpsE
MSAGAPHARPSFRIVAEMAWAHDGSLDKAINIMRGAKAAGADFIGIHLTDMPTYMVRHYGSGAGRVSAGKEHVALYEYLERINLSQDDWRVFNEAAQGEGIGLCVMPNDLASLKFAEADLHPECYALTAAAFVEPGFVEAIARCGRTTLFRIGGATLGEIEQAVNQFRMAGAGEIVLLHGFQNYPTKLEDTNIRQLEVLARMFGTPVGLADHIDGADPLARVIPPLSLACGATWIEKHITHDRDERGEDFEAALDPEQFAEFVGNVRAAAVALGVSEWLPLSEAALRYRSVTRKRAVARHDLPAGHVLRQEDIVFKRSDHGVAGDEIALVLGRRLKASVARDDGIGLDVVE